MSVVEDKKQPEITFPKIPDSMDDELRDYFIARDQLIIDNLRNGIYVGKMITNSPWIDPRDFGAVGDNSSDDTEAIQNALDSMADGDNFYLPPGNYKTTSVIEAKNLSNCKFDFAGTIRPVGCSGITFETLHSCIIDVKRVQRDTVDWGVGNYWGVKFTEVNFCPAHVNSSLYFTYGIYFDANNGKGICYNNFTFERVTAKYGLCFSATNGGWINANNYFGGKLYLDSSTKYSKITYDVSGTLDPDVEGTYAYAGLYNDKPSYKLAGQEWYIWYEEGFGWFISTVKGTAGDNYWSRAETTIPGTYSPTGGSGNAEVTGIETNAWGIFFADSPSNPFHDHNFYGPILESLFNGIRFSTNYNIVLDKPYFEKVDANYISVGVKCDNLKWTLGAGGLVRAKLDIDSASFDHFTIIGKHPDKKSSIIFDGSDEGGFVPADPTDSLAALGRFSYDAANDRWNIEDNLHAVGRITSGTKTITASADDTDVSGINTLFVNTTSGNVTLGGLVGGIDGQRLSIIKIVAVNDLILEHEEGVENTDDFFMHQLDDEIIDAGGVEVVYNGTTEKWHDSSHAKHV